MAWVERSERRGRTLVRWLERQKPGHPGVTERRYLSNVEEDRFGGAVALVEAGLDRAEVRSILRSRSPRSRRPAWWLA